MKYLAYALQDGAFDGRPTETPWVNTYHAWAFTGYVRASTETIDDWLPRMVHCVERAVGLGMFVFLELDMGRNADMNTRATVTRIIQAMKPFWSSVIAVSVADEPAIDKQTAKAWYAKVRDVIKSLGLESRPVGIGLSVKQSVDPDDPLIQVPKYSAKGDLKGPDFIILELYAGPNGVNTGQEANMEFVRRNIDTAVARIDPRIKVWFWVCGFDRNGAFNSEDDLAVLNKQSYKFARDKHHSDGSKLDPEVFLIFNWARKTGATTTSKVGTKWLPKVQQKHRWISADMGLNKV